MSYISSKNSKAATFSKLIKEVPSNGKKLELIWLGSYFIASVIIIICSEFCKSKLPAKNTDIVLQEVWKDIVFPQFLSLMFYVTMLTELVEL